MGASPSRVRNLAIQDVIRDTQVDGPVLEFAEEIRQLHLQSHTSKTHND